MQHKTGLCGIGSDRKYNNNNWSLLNLKCFVLFRLDESNQDKGVYSLFLYVSPIKPLFFAKLVIEQEAHSHRMGRIYFTSIDYTNYTLLIML